jgi:hypothetical protein
VKIYFFNIKKISMKRILTLALLSIALLFCIRGQGQSITPSILNSSGGSYDNPSSYTRYEWSFGELVLTDTYIAAGGNLIITQGLLQPCTDKVGGEPLVLLFGLNEWKIFPNVTAGQFELDFFLTLPGQMQLQLTDAMGRVINTRNFQYHCCDRIERYDISAQPNGVYFINARYTPDKVITTDAVKPSRVGTFKVVKVR